MDEKDDDTVGQLARGLPGDEAVEGVHEYVGTELAVGVEVRDACHANGLLRG